MLIFIYLFLAIFCLSVAFVIIFSRKRYLNLNPQQFDIEYDGHKLFMEMSFATLRFFWKKVTYYAKFVWQYFLHTLVQLTSFVSKLSDILYGKIRNIFVYTAVNNKRSVPHFWDYLKKYKREIDEEKENKVNKIYDSSLENF